MASTVRQLGQADAGTWARVRALVITCVLVVQGISAIPAQPLDAERLSRREGERLVDVIASVFAFTGTVVERRTIKRQLIRGTRRAVALRHAFLAPFAPVLDNLASRQQWGLFLMGGGDFFKMHVDVRIARTDFQPVYIAGELDRAGLESTLRYRRMRGLYNPSVQRGPPADYDGFVAWLAGELFRADPDYEVVRVRMQHLRLTPTASAPPRSLGFQHVRERTRGRQP